MNMEPRCFSFLSLLCYVDCYVNFIEIIDTWTYSVIQVTRQCCDLDWMNEVVKKKICKKCLKVRQKLGTRRNLKIWKFKFKFQKLKWLKLILGTCWTSFVFMSMLKSRCLYPKIAMLFLTKLFIYAFFGTTSAPAPLTLPFIELVPS